MALMIPNHPMNSYEGEDAVFNALQSGLDDSYVIFHSVRWVGSSPKSQGEADFLILHRSLGILIVEVKGGYMRSEGRQWYQKNRATLVEKEIRDPLAQADTSKWKFIEVLSLANPAIKWVFNLSCSVVSIISLELFLSQIMRLKLSLMNKL